MAESEREQPIRRALNEDPIGAIFDGLSDFTSAALQRAAKQSEKAFKTLNRTPQQLRRMAAAGESLRDMREVAGLNLSELSSALNMGDKSLLEAAEEGKATLPFEIILRLSSLLARNDPVPFVLKFTRSYNPRLWEFLNDWGVGRLPLQYEREREFINIYRKDDAVRELDDEDFAKVLAFTDSAFDMAMHFVADAEDEIENESDDNELEEDEG
ncbi:MAG: helix-turn-helix domain-containing protein [Pseudomonadales bacterium]